MTGNDARRLRNIIVMKGYNSLCKLFTEYQFWHYSLQLNTYKALLEKNYGVKVGDLYLVCLHPDNKNGSYIKYKCADLSSEVKDLFELRQKMLNNKRNANIENTAHK